MICGQWTEAARRAGFSEKTALVKSGMWVKATRAASEKPAMFDYLKKLQEEAENEFNVTKGKVLKGYHSIAAFDIRKLFDDFGDLKPLSELDDETVLAIAGLEVTETIVGDELVKTKIKKIKIPDKNAAWAGIAKMLGYNAPDKIEPVGGFLDFLKQASQAK